MQDLEAAPSSGEMSPTLPLSTELGVPPVSELAAMAAEEAEEFLRLLGKGPVVKTAFEELADSPEALADWDVAKIGMTGPTGTKNTNYTMPEGDTADD